MANAKQNTGGGKKGPSKLPSKQISFSGQPKKQVGKKVNASVSSSKKGGVNLMRKLSGM